jgi:hypothetical protein
VVVAALLVTTANLMAGKLEKLAMPTSAAERQAGNAKSGHSLTGTAHLCASCSAATAHIPQVDTNIGVMFPTAIMRDNSISIPGIRDHMA